MKTSTALTVSAVVAMLSLDSANAIRSYLQKLPNGDAAFEQALGHVGSTSKPNAFGELFSSSGGEWNDKLCRATFPGASMTVGEAFGDPCCTWKVGGTPDFKVTPFTTPTKKNECAKNAPASSSPPASSTPAPTPSSGGKPAGKPTQAPVAPAGNTTAVPSGKPSGDKPSGGKPVPGSKCGVKKEEKSLSRDDDYKNWRNY